MESESSHIRSDYEDLEHRINNLKEKEQAFLKTPKKDRKRNDYLALVAEVTQLQNRKTELLGVAQDSAAIEDQLLAEEQMLNQVTRELKELAQEIEE